MGMILFFLKSLKQLFKHPMFLGYALAYLYSQS